MCMAFICTFANAGLPSNEPELSGDTYQIGTKAELLWYFNDERGFQHNAVLTNDITLEANIFEGGHVNYVESEIPRKSIPQGITFDGNGHKIIGFCAGSSLFSTNNGTIKNLILEDAYTTGTSLLCEENRGEIINCETSGLLDGMEDYGFGVGSICRINYSKIIHCTNKATIKAPYAGGIVGSTYSSIVACLNTGTVDCGDEFVGYANGIAYHIEDGLIHSCLNVGELTGSHSPHTDGIASTPFEVPVSRAMAAQAESRKDSPYSILKSMEYGESGIINCYSIYGNGQKNATQEEVANGHVAMMLQKVFDEEIHWGQTIGVDNTPVLTYDENKLVKHIIISGALVLDKYVNSYTADPNYDYFCNDIKWDGNLYKTETKLSTYPAGEQETVLISFTGAYEDEFLQRSGTDVALPAPSSYVKYYIFKVGGVEWSGRNVTEDAQVDVTEADVVIEGEGTEQSPYIISTPRQLLLFGRIVSEDNPAACGKLTSDIDFEGMDFSPISGYKGTFDGQMHRIKNLHIESNSDYCGLFGVVKGGATIKNTIIDKSCSIKGQNYCAGLVGGSNGSGTITIENCGNEATITGGINAAGIIGVNMETLATFVIRNCYNTGAINGEIESAAISGWLGNGAKVYNCYNSGTISGYEMGRTFVRGNGYTCEKCYSTVEEQNAAALIDADKLKSPEFTYTLNDDAENTIWCLTIDGDNSHPSFFPESSKNDGTTNFIPFKVVFKDYDETELKTTYTDKDGNVEAPDDPARDDYYFNGWDNPTEGITSDCVLHPVYGTTPTAIANVKDVEKDIIGIYDLSGRKVSANDTQSLSRGVYIIKTTNGSQKVSVK